MFCELWTFPLTTMAPTTPTSVRPQTLLAPHVAQPLYKLKVRANLIFVFYFSGVEQIPINMFLYISILNIFLDIH